MGLLNRFFVSFSADTEAQRGAPVPPGARAVSCIQTDFGTSPEAFGHLRAGGGGGGGGKAYQHAGSGQQRVRGTRDGRLRLHRQASRHKEHLGEF